MPFSIFKNNVSLVKVLEPVMLVAIEGEGAKLGEGILST
jgi:hypothetical protein